MSYRQTGNIYGAIPLFISIIRNSDGSTGTQGGYDNQTVPPSRSPQSVQAVGVPRHSRSVSSTRATAPAQTQPIPIPYGVGQQSWGK